VTLVSGCVNIYTYTSLSLPLDSFRWVPFVQFMHCLGLDDRRLRVRRWMHLEISFYFFEPRSSGSNSHCTIQLLVSQLQVCECGSEFALYYTAGCFSSLLVRWSLGAFSDVYGSNPSATLWIEVAVASLNQTPKILNTIVTFHACQSTHFIHITADLSVWHRSILLCW
jgi:hypothetical protein